MYVFIYKLLKACTFSTSNCKMIFVFFKINVETQRGFVPVDERMQVQDKNGNLVCCERIPFFYIFVASQLLITYFTHFQVPHVYCIGDANGKMMLAHAASAQGISGRRMYFLYI